MSKNKLNLIIDVLAYLGMVALASTGLILAYGLPPGTGGRHGGGRGVLTLLGRSRHEWGDVHFALAIALLVLVLLHLVLHWRWVANLLRAPLLIVLGLAAAGVLGAPWLIGVKGGTSGDRHAAAAEGGCDTCAAGCGTAAPAADEHHGKEHGEGHGKDEGWLRGRSTLAEAAQSVGRPLPELLQALGLPATTAPATRLADVAQQKSQSMHDLRESIDKLRAAPQAK
ncbi:DUF4405 domain-containing protein [bacterium]|nr:DUF4405 domain-containing protein [bacterium]